MPGGPGSPFRPEIIYESFHYIISGDLLQFFLVNTSITGLFQVFELLRFVPVFLAGMIFQFLQEHTFQKMSTPTTNKQKIGIKK